MSVKQDINELGKVVDLPGVYTKEVVERLKKQILLSLYRHNPEQVTPEYLATVKSIHNDIEVIQEEIDIYNEDIEARITTLSKDEESAEKNKEKIERYEDKLETYIFEQNKKIRALKRSLKQLEERKEEVIAFNKELNKKIMAVYKNKHNREFNPKVHAKNKNLPLFLMGPPGQGKTASYQAAAKETCAELGLNFVSHVTDNYVPSLHDFVLVVQECAGENSAITFGGVPKAEEITLADGTKRSVLKKAINYRFTVFEHCAGGVLLFDDAANAASVIQNVLLPVAQNGTFQGLHIPNALIGFTGNLGALDGTYVSEQSSALLTRVIPVFVTDTIDDFCHRGYGYYNDDLGDLGFFNFLKRNPEKFAGLPKQGAKSGFACSRTHDNFIQQARGIVEMNGGRGIGEANSLSELGNLAKSCYGPILGGEIAAYYYSYLRGADPLARKYIQDGKFDKEEFATKYNGGASPADITFGYQFATACGDYTVNLITSAKEISFGSEQFAEAIKRFAKASLALNDSEFSFALEHLKNKLSANVPDFSQPARDTRELRNDVREKIARLINADPECSAGKRKILIEVITDFDKMSGNMSLNAKPARKKID